MIQPRAATELGRAIALVLRGGTLLAVAGIGAGFLLALFDDSPRAGPMSLLDMVRGGGADALIGGGMLVLALTPPATVLVAAIVLERRGERRHAVIAAAVFVLLFASLAAAAVLARPS